MKKNTSERRTVQRSPQGNRPVHQVQIAPRQTRHARVRCQARSSRSSGRNRTQAPPWPGCWRTCPQACRKPAGTARSIPQAKLIGDPRQHWRKDHKTNGGQKAPTKRRHARDHQRITRAPLFGHRIAVERGHQRRFVARNVEQDRLNPPAIHRAVIDDVMQHQRRCASRPRLKVIGIRIATPFEAQARQRPDDCAQKTPDDCKHQRVGRTRRPKAHRQI